MQVGHTLSKFVDGMKLRGVADSPEGPGQAGHMGWQSHEVQQEVQNPASREEQPQGPVHAGGHPAVKQPCRREPGGPAGHQAEYESAVHPCC